MQNHAEKRRNIAREKLSFAWGLIMSDLTILILVTTFLFTCLTVFMYKYARYIESLERIRLKQPVARTWLLSVSFFAPMSFVVFILAIAGLI